MAKEVLVIGGAGYIGSKTTGELVKSGHRVTVMDNFTYGPNSLGRVQMTLDRVPLLDTLRVSDPQIHPRDFDFEVINTDTRDRDKTREVVHSRNFDYVIHLGELVGISACDVNPKETEDINYYGTRNVVDAVLSSPYQPQFAWPSSSSVYHTSKDGSDFTEKSSLPPDDKLDNYCRNKVLVERYINEQLRANVTFQAIILRPATVGGLSPRTRIELFPNHIAYSLLTTDKFSLANAGDKRAVISIDDIAGFFTRLVESGKWQNGTYNIGHLNESKGWFVREIARILGKDPDDVIVPVGKAGDLRNLTIDSTLLETTFGYKPSHGLEDIVGPIALLLGDDKKNAQMTVFAQNHNDLLLVKREFTNTPPEEFREMLTIR